MQRLVNCGFVGLQWYKSIIQEELNNWMEPTLLPGFAPMILNQS